MNLIKLRWGGSYKPPTTQALLFLTPGSHHPEFHSTLPLIYLQGQRNSSGRWRARKKGPGAAGGIYSVSTPTRTRGRNPCCFSFLFSCENRNSLRTVSAILRAWEKGQRRAGLERGSQGQQSLVSLSRGTQGLMVSRGTPEALRAVIRGGKAKPHAHRAPAAGGVQA